MNTNTTRHTGDVGTANDGQDYYRCPLKKIPAPDGIYNLTSLEAAAKQLAPHSTLDLHHEIYAIVPLSDHNFTQSLIVYEHYILLVGFTPYQLIKRMTADFLKLDYSIYHQALTQLLEKEGRRKYKIPFATARFSLVPLTKSRSKDTLWLNPGKLDAYYTKGLETIIRLHNDVAFVSPIRSKSLLQHFYHGFIAQGILKREVTCPLQVMPTNLVEFLALRPSKTIHRILKDCSLYDLPRARGDFYQIYRDIYAEQGDVLAC